MSTASEANYQTFPVEAIAVSKLAKSPLNVRKTVENAALEELKASIIAHGLMQNLIVTAAKKGRYHVIAGARRLAALQALQEEGKLPADHAVLCQIVSPDAALEMSLAENTVRVAMHPADEFEAFAALSDSGLSSAKIAERWGVDEKHVLQRLKLGRVAPELLADYREGKIKLETLMAFTITDDHARQLSVYRSLQGWQQDNPRHIRDCLTDKLIAANSNLARFVGLEAYAAAGGRSKSDLFGDAVYLEDAVLLNRLAGEKLEAAAAELRGEGWGWVEISAERDWEFCHRCGEIEPQPLNAPQALLDQKAKLEADLEAAEEAYWDDEGEDEAVSQSLEKRRDELEEQLEAIDAKLKIFVAFDPEEMKTAGCYAWIGGGGQIDIKRGLVKPEDKKAVAKTQPGASDDEPETEPTAKLSESLKRDLEAYRLGAAQAEIAKHPAIAFDLLVFKAAKSVCGISHAYDGPQVSFQRDYGGTVSADAREFIGKQMDAIEKTLPLDWQELDNEADQFAAFQRLTDEQKHALLAYCVASTLQPKLAPASADRATAYDIALSQTGANVADYWRPSAANFLSRIKTAELLAIGQEIFGEIFATQYAKAKKSELVAVLDKGFANPDSALDPERVRRLSNWLPEGMAFPAIEPAAEPKPAKKKGKKAA